MPAAAREHFRQGCTCQAGKGGAGGAPASVSFPRSCGGVPEQGPEGPTLPASQGAAHPARSRPPFSVDIETRATMSGRGRSGTEPAPRRGRTWGRMARPSQRSRVFLRNSDTTKTPPALGSSGGLGAPALGRGQGQGEDGDLAGAS